MAGIPAPLARLVDRPAVAGVLGRATDVLLGAPAVRGRLTGPFRPARRHRVSVIMPSYGYARFLPAAVESIATQEGVDVELIVVDDLGPDDSYEVALREAARYPEGTVRVLRNERNLGPAATFTVGRKAATGEFLVRCDADDELAPGALARAVAVFEQVPTAALVYGPADMYETPEHGPAPSAEHARAVVYAGQDWLRHVVTEDRNLIGTPEAMLRMSVFDTVGEWTDNRHGQDFEAWMRAATAGDVVHLEGCLQAFKRNHSENLSATQGYRGTANYRAHAQAYADLFRLAGDRITGADELQARGHRALADRALGDLVHAYTRGPVDPEFAAEVEELARPLGPSASTLAALGRARALGPDARRDPRLLGRAALRAARRELRNARYRARGL